MQRVKKTDTFKHNLALKGDWFCHPDTDPLFYLGYVQNQYAGKRSAGEIICKQSI